MVTVERRDQATLLPIIQARIRPGTTIVSDCWKAYDHLEALGYHHMRVNHSKVCVDEDTGAHTNSIEGNWCHAKRFLPKYGLPHECLDAYLGAFLWRRVHRGEDLFAELLREIARAYPVKNL